MKRTFLLFLICAAGTMLIAQVPQGINYQAAAFNSTGTPIANATIQVKIGILSDTITPVVVWEELHNDIKTSAGGVFSLVVGSGTKQAGSAVTFGDIQWNLSPLFLKVQIYFQGSWKYLGSAKLWSVPYAMSAAGIGGPVSKLTVVGETTSPEEALFEVKNRDGQTIFAVYNEGVRMYVDDGSKGGKGGFAVGGFGTDKAPSQNLLFISSDSIRAYVETGAKATKGGFAVGGFDAAKGVQHDLLVVSGDSIRAYINDSNTKATKGGFAVGGYDATKGTTDSYMHITNDSTLFYVHELSPGNSSSFNIVGLSSNMTRSVLMSANTDTVGVGGVLDVRNNLNVAGNIGYTGDFNLIVPMIMTLEAFNISDTSAMVRCMIEGNGGSPVTASGVCWSTTTNPTDKLATRTAGVVTQGEFTSVITGLLPSTTYYVRAYAVNANGTGYGQEMSFTTPAAGTIVSDIDGNIYNLISIGTQVWMAQNLKTTRLNDGTAIPNVTDETAWNLLSTPAYAWYNNDGSTYSAYGPLYNWMTVNSGKLCPAGWHVPSEPEWSALSTFLGGNMVAGGKLKEPGSVHWLSQNTGATNDYGFTALPGGMRSYMGPFLDLGMTGNWWTSTMISVDPASVMMFNSTAELLLTQAMSGMGQSVRCLRD